MTTFRVTITGTKIIMKTEEGEEALGFIRNEYVWADTEETAITKAKKKVLSRLSEKKGITQLADCPLELVVDEIERGIPIWKLTSNESFIFFDLEEGG